MRRHNQSFPQVPQQKKAPSVVVQNELFVVRMLLKSKESKMCESERAHASNRSMRLACKKDEFKGLPQPCSVLCYPNLE